MANLKFIHLNPDWNAEPNVAVPEVVASGDLVSVKFLLNPFAYDAAAGETGTLQFLGCSCWRIDFTNDHAWFAGKGRFSSEAPNWGEFFEICGKDESIGNYEWIAITELTSEHRHYIFYFRDEAFECFATSWSLIRKRPNPPLD